MSAALGLEHGTLSDYDVLKAIGKGKFSVVFRAKRRSDGCLVAVKKVNLFDIGDDKKREKCLKEVRYILPAKL